MKPVVTSLEDLRLCLYNHVMDAIDWDKIYGYEQMLWMLLSDLGHDDVGEMADTMIRECVIRAASDPMRNISDVPFGITKAEERAVAREDDCVFCQADANASDSEHDAADDDCPCCNQMAADWRAEHEVVLRKAGLWRAPPS